VGEHAGNVLLGIPFLTDFSVQYNKFNSIS
jgi:hypothetical protein